MLPELRSLRGVPQESATHSIPRPCFRTPRGFVPIPISTLIREKGLDHRLGCFRGGSLLLKAEQNARERRRILPRAGVNPEL